MISSLAVRRPDADASGLSNTSRYMLTAYSQDGVMSIVSFASGVVVVFIVLLLIGGGGGNCTPVRAEAVESKHPL